MQRIIEYIENQSKIEKMNLEELEYLVSIFLDVSCELATIEEIILERQRELKVNLI